MPFSAANVDQVATSPADTLSQVSFKFGVRCACRRPVEGFQSFVGLLDEGHLLRVDDVRAVVVDFLRLTPASGIGDVLNQSATSLPRALFCFTRK